MVALACEHAATWILTAMLLFSGIPMATPLPSSVRVGDDSALLRFQRPVLVDTSKPNVSSGGPTGPQHAWFPDDAGVIGGLAPAGPQAIVVGVRHSCDGCHQNPLPHPEQTFVSYDDGQSYHNLSWSSATDPQAGTIYGTATYRGPRGQLVGNCCVHHRASNCTFAGGAVITYTVDTDGTGRFQGINRNASHEGQVSYSFPFPAAEFTYASSIVSIGGGNMVQLRAFSKQTHTDVPQQSLAAFGTADGLQWKFLSMVAQDNATLMQLDWEGPGENDLLRLRDGMLLAVFRVESCQSYWKATSTNGGEVWSHPVALGFGSVRPKLLLLAGSGRPLLSGGRPGLFLWLGDSSGEHWTQISVPKLHNSLLPDKPAWQYGPQFVAAVDRCVDWNSTADQEHRIMGATGYTSLLALGKGRYVLLYDRLANGWSPPVWKGRPGVWGDRDRVFSLAFAEEQL